MSETQARAPISEAQPSKIVNNDALSRAYQGFANKTPEQKSEALKPLDDAAKERIKNLPKNDREALIAQMKEESSATNTPPREKEQLIKAMRVLNGQSEDCSLNNAVGQSIEKNIHKNERGLRGIISGGLLEIAETAVDFALQAPVGEAIRAARGAGQIYNVSKDANATLTECGKDEHSSIETPQNIPAKTASRTK